MKWQDKHTILIKIARGLSAIDEAGLVHCDLHPGNILVHETRGGGGSFRYTIYDTYIGDLGMCHPPDDSLKADQLAKQIVTMPVKKVTADVIRIKEEMQKLIIQK